MEHVKVRQQSIPEQPSDTKSEHWQQKQDRLLQQKVDHYAWKVAGNPDMTSSTRSASRENHLRALLES